MFNCPKCNQADNKVSQGRLCGSNYVRVHVCKVCGNRFYTAESIIDYLDGYNQISNWWKEKYINGIKIRRNNEKCK